jgi:hypothetical protein
MKTIDFFIHDARIIKVIENTNSDTLDFILDYPVDWENNKFEKKILRFNDSLNYEIKEIPFSGSPSILEYKDYGELHYFIGEGKNKIEIKRRKIELITNAGNRKIEYNSLELLDYE